MRAAMEDGTLELKHPVNCVCGAEPLEPISAYDRFGLPFGTAICRRCGLVRLTPFIAERSLRYYYDKIYHPLHFESELTALPSLFAKGQGAKIFERVKTYLAARDPVSVLEIGAGTGSVLAEFDKAAAAAGCRARVVGTEFSSECVKIASSKGIEMITGAFDEVIETGQRFDLVVLSHVFEHFTDLPEALRRTHAVLAEGGIVYVEVPGIMALHARPGYRFDYIRYVTHAHVFHFNLASLVDVFGRGGFELLTGNEEVEAVFAPAPSAAGG